MAGDVREFQLLFQPGNAKDFGVEVHCDAQGKNGFVISVETDSQILRLGDLRVPLALKAGESVELRIFLDKSMIEILLLPLTRTMSVALPVTQRTLQRKARAIRDRTRSSPKPEDEIPIP